MPESPTRREVLAAAAAVGALGGEAAAQESDSGSDEATPTGDVDWPMFQADSRNTGYAPGSLGPVEDGEVTWSTERGPAGISAPAVVGDTVYVGNVQGRVQALSAVEGDLRWAFEMDEAVTSSPAVSDGTVYVGCDDGSVYALGTDDGDLRWSHGTGGSVRSSPAVADVPTAGGGPTSSSGGGPPSSSGGGSTPSSGGGPAAGERVVFIGSQDGGVYALSAADGTQLWTTDVGSVEASPAVAPSGDGDTVGGVSTGPGTGGTVYVGTVGGGVYALSATDGAEQWSTEVDGRAGAPTAAGDAVYAPSTDGSLHALSATDGSERWRFGAPEPVRSPAVAGDVVYVPSIEQGLYALSAADGEERWRFESDGETSPPVVADAPGDVSNGDGGTVYVTGMDEGLSVHALSAAEGRLRWSTEVDGKLAGPPAVAEGTLYVNAGNVIALGAEARRSTPTSTPWDPGAVLASWAPTVGAWLAASVGVPAVLGTVLYALGRIGRGGKTGDSGGPHIEDSRGSQGATGGESDDGST